MPEGCLSSADEQDLRSSGCRGVKHLKFLGPGFYAGGQFVPPFQMPKHQVGNVYTNRKIDSWPRPSTNNTARDPTQTRSSPIWAGARANRKKTLHKGRRYCSDNWRKRASEGRLLRPKTASKECARSETGPACTAFKDRMAP